MTLGENGAEGQGENKACWSCKPVDSFNSVSDMIWFRPLKDHMHSLQTQSSKSGTVIQSKDGGGLMEMERTAQAEGYLKGLSISSLLLCLPTSPQGWHPIVYLRIQNPNFSHWTLGLFSCHMSVVWMGWIAMTAPHVASSGTFASEPCPRIFPLCPVSSEFSILLLSLQ